MKLSVRSPDGFRARSDRNSVVPLAMIYVRQRELANARMLCHGVDRSRVCRDKGDRRLATSATLRGVQGFDVPTT
jgi:hypothetical protein